MNLMTLSLVVAGCGARTDLPTAPPGPPAILSVTAGYSFTCALHGGGTVECWGDNRDGELGDGTTNASARPVRVTGLERASAVSAGYDHACALLSDGSVRCWGSDEVGQLGDGIDLAASPGGPTTRATAVVGLHGSATAVSAGDCFTCALLASGEVDCWGGGYNGELGDSAQDNSSIPVKVPGVENAIAIGSGGLEACAVLASGEAVCWGDNMEGELGTSPCPGPINMTHYCPTAATPVPGVVGAAGVTAGNLAACAWMADGSAQCWGLNIGGYLGRGGSNVATTWGPYPSGTVVGVSAAISVTMGDDHACALTQGGTVMCWGENHGGQIGNGSGVDAYVPVEVPALAGVTAIAAGGDHTCAVAGGQTIYCWGADSYGEVGDASADGGTCDDGFSGKVRCVTTPVVVPWTP
jgi:alpha-tubulin suppressor-like RCC1 family protein